MDEQLLNANQEHLNALLERVLHDRQLIVASNRGPLEFNADETGALEETRGAGGLVTAMSSITHYVTPTWVAAALTDGDRQRAADAGDEPIRASGNEQAFDLHFVQPTAEEYQGYYNVIANPLLWFLQHSMWDSPRTPNITSEVWAAWDQYVQVNHLFAEAILKRAKGEQVIVMLQDYHLYLVARELRAKLDHRAFVSLFVHIPWPAADYWALLPDRMRLAILEGCCNLDVLGFHTDRYGTNFLNTCQVYLPDADIDYKRRTISLNGRTTAIRSYPISIDVRQLTTLAQSSEEVRDQRYRLRGRLGDQTIMRIDRVEPSKNIVRGFQAFELLLKEHPEHIGRVKFLAFLVPSRLGVEEYQRYLEEIMITTGWINTRYGTGDWQPVELIVGDDYLRGIAAMQLYDVLLVNAVADGMNLVAKEGPTVNDAGGVLILSEGTGATSQLGEAALIVTPSDIVGTANALHSALTMPLAERHQRASQLKQLIAEEDITMWLFHQFVDVEAHFKQPTAEPAEAQA